MIHILSIYSTIFNESIIKILAYKMAGGGKPPRGGNPPEIYGNEILKIKLKLKNINIKKLIFISLIKYKEK